MDPAEKVGRRASHVPRGPPESRRHGRRPRLHRLGPPRAGPAAVTLPTRVPRPGASPGSAGPPAVWRGPAAVPTQGTLSFLRSPESASQQSPPGGRKGTSLTPPASVQGSPAGFHGRRQLGRPGVWRGGQGPSCHVTPGPHVQTRVSSLTEAFHREPAVPMQMGPRRVPVLVRGSGGLRLPAPLAWMTRVPHSACHVHVALWRSPACLHQWALPGGPSQPICFVPRKIPMVFVERTWGDGPRPGGGRPVPVHGAHLSGGPCGFQGGSWRSLSYVSLTTATVTGVVALRRRHKWVSLPFRSLEFRVFVFAFFSGFHSAGRGSRWLLSLGRRVTRERPFSSAASPSGARRRAARVPGAVGTPLWLCQAGESSGLC